MDLATIEMPVEEAQAAFEEYRGAVRAGPRAKFNEARREYEQLDRAIMRGYKEIAKGHALIKLSEAMVRGGVMELTWENRGWREGTVHVTHHAAYFPRLAVCRADARHCLTTGVRSDGTLTLNADGRSRKADTLRFEGFQEPTKHEYRQHRAIVPTIPPPFRPPHNLSGYHILWEANWEAMAPVDPALLKHLGGDLYAVLAVWDLTELEQAVLGGMRGE